jgi:methionyl aminopeptidase
VWPVWAADTGKAAGSVWCVTIDGDDDLQGLRRAGRAVAEARDAMLAAAVPGATTADLDAVGRRILRSHGARSAPQLAVGFPAATCVSVNDQAAHGVPSPLRVLRAGDLVNVDVSAELDGYWADTGASAPVGPTEGVAPIARRLVEATRSAQSDAMAAARAGQPLRHIGRAVERRARRHGFRVIGNLCGHGVGGSLHEAPSVPSIERMADDVTLWEGLVLAIEPFLSTGADVAVEDADGWTLRTPDGSLSAQFEHTIVVTNGRPLVLTAAAA